MTMRLRGSLGWILAFAAACGGDDATDPAQGTTSGNPAGSTGAGSSSTTAETSSSSGSAESSGTTGSADTSTSSADTGSDSGSSSTGATGLTWENFGEGFFESYCWECHGAGDAVRDYSTLAGVMPELVSIRCGTGPASDPPDGCEGEPPPEQFPIGDTIPTQDERVMLVEWIDAGAP